MASTTKIMTCILALENAGFEETVQVSDYAASMPDVQLGIRAGETYRMEDLLYSMMLESHNDSAVAIAEHVGGSREGFADMMNQKARDIGCADTHFITPNGLDASVEATGEVHSTTAEDLARILRYCILQSPKKEEFLTITRAPSRAFSDLSGSRSFSCINHNALLTSMEGAVSGKTGFTNGAGYCYVGAVEKDGKLFIASLLACGWPPHKNYKWQDMQKLISYGKDAYDYYDILKKDMELPAVPVKNGIRDTAELEIAYPGHGLPAGPYAGGRGGQNRKKDGEGADGAGLCGPGSRAGGILCGRYADRRLPGAGEEGCRGMESEISCGNPFKAVFHLI